MVEGAENGFGKGFLRWFHGVRIRPIHRRISDRDAVSILNVTPDYATLGLLIFAIGFIVGMLTVALSFVIVKLSRLPKS
jgi:hypothetical protein